MAAVMTDQDLYPRGFGGFAQADAVGQRVRDRFFDEGRDAGLNALDRHVGVQLVGRRQDHAVRLVVGKHLGERGVDRHAGVLRGTGEFGGRRRIDDSR